MVMYYFLFCNFFLDNFCLLIIRNFCDAPFPYFQPKTTAFVFLKDINTCFY